MCSKDQLLTFKRILFSEWTLVILDNAMKLSELVAAAARTKLNLANATLSDGHYYASLPLCVIDSVFSIGARYESTRRTVIRWATAQEPDGL